MVINKASAGQTVRSPLSQVMRGVDADHIAEGRYLAKLAETPAEVESALRLRFEVFKVELAAAKTDYDNGLDCDDYDASCHHLIVVDKLTESTVGTYRLNPIESAKNARGFYSFNEFSVEDLPADVIRQSVEIGRACIAPAHRNSKVLFLLWKGLLNYLQSNRKRYFFGCCSLFSRDVRTGVVAYQYFSAKGMVHPEFKVLPRPERALPADVIFREDDQIELPELFKLYLKTGVRICGAPALDRDFGTIDFFVLFDLLEMTEKYRKLFFRRTENFELNAIPRSS